MNKLALALKNQREAKNTLVCVGLDIDLSKLPTHMHTSAFAWTREIVKATAEYACCYKPNMAFYEAIDAEYPGKGQQLLFDIVHHIYEDYGMPVILDGKRADIGNTCEAYVKYFRQFNSGDFAITSNPYMGGEAIHPFRREKDMTTFYVVRTSNPGSDEFQALKLEDGKMLWEHVADQISCHWNVNDNCGVVIGATHPNEIATARKIIGPDMLMLIPGIGKQGGDLEAAVRGGGDNSVINSSRGIIYASFDRNFASAAGSVARNLRDNINQFRG